MFPDFFVILPGLEGFKGNKRAHYRLNNHFIIPDISTKLKAFKGVIIEIREISWTFPGNFPNISRKFPGHFEEFSRTFPETNLDISRKFPGISWTIPKTLVKLLTKNLAKKTGQNISPNIWPKIRDYFL